jgi:ribosomal subunit interface protein
MSTLSWNLATKDLQSHELLRNKLEEKIKKLEKHLQHYPAGSLLQIVLERHPRKPLFVAKLTLHVPANILRSEKSAWDVIKAFDDAVKALLRELASLKADLRREAYWKRKDRRKELHALKSTGGGLLS